MLELTLVPPLAGAGPQIPTGLYVDALTRIYTRAWALWSTAPSGFGVVQSQVPMGAEWPICGYPFAAKYLTAGSSYWTGVVPVSTLQQWFPLCDWGSVGAAVGAKPYLLQLAPYDSTLATVVFS